MVVVSGVLVVWMVSGGIIGGVGVGGAGGVPAAVTIVVVLPPLLSKEPNVGSGLVTWPVT